MAPQGDHDAGAADDCSSESTAWREAEQLLISHVTAAVEALDESMAQSLGLKRTDVVVDVVEKLCDKENCLECPPSQVR